MPDPSPEPDPFDPSPLDPSPEPSPEPDPSPATYHPTLTSRAELYLGDGLYASFDGWSVWLRAPRGDGDHRVALEPGTLRNFQDWSAPIRKHFRAG